MSKPAEQIAKEAEHLEGKENRAMINKLFREQDDSHLYPIFNKFNVTDRAIRHAQEYTRKGGDYLTGLEYALTIESNSSQIVNDPTNN